MFERSLLPANVEEVIQQGEVIADYPDDSPYPSALILGFVEGQPIHAVVAMDVMTNRCHVVTAYRPDPGKWTPDFRSRRHQ
jgi:hypothetical protein